MSDKGENSDKGDNPDTGDSGGRRWFLTAFLALLLIVVAVVIYLVKFRSMEFFYVLF